MDLNLFYSRHQHSVMQAASATSRLASTRHMATAALIAHRIGSFQRELQASASAGWQRCSENIDKPKPGPSMHSCQELSLPL
jgi:hypothetical protein